MVRAIVAFAYVLGALWIVVATTLSFAERHDLRVLMFGLSVAAFAIIGVFEMYTEVRK